MKIYVNKYNDFACQYKDIKYIKTDTTWGRKAIDVYLKSESVIASEFFKTKKEAKARFDFLVKEWNESLNS